MAFCFQALPLFGQDQDTNTKDRKDAKAEPHAAGKEKSVATKQTEKGKLQGDVSRSDRSRDGNSANNTAGARRSMESANQNSKVAKQSVRQTNQRQSQQNQTTAIVVQGSQANHYNGRWIAGSTHSDWDRRSNHQWRNHDYRWYDGGWLIIDTGESPGYYETGSMVIKVKESLAEQGYYNGHLTEHIGPHTRQAISNYESDKGLPVNGQIDGPLLVSLGLE